ncbi:MAG: HD domain-containing protein [Candidatus Nanoarchaeia archaeon]|nr:HD domain-containing protein [Candidatus Nanoarchaeia archaeon]
MNYPSLREIAFNYMNNISSSAHDLSHVIRVENNVIKLKEGIKLDEDVLFISTWFHDSGRYEELQTGIGHEIISARIVEEELPKIQNFPIDKIPKIVYCIKSHRYTSNLKPNLLEAQILQDADRLDALGAIGLARLFAHDNKRKLYHEKDPFYELQRELEKNKYTLDQYFKKMRKIKDTLNTDRAKKIATIRIRFMNLFLEQFKKEIEGKI